MTARKYILTILLAVLALLAVLPTASAQTAEITTATAHFSQYRYFVQDPIAYRVSGKRFQWEYCAWALTFSTAIPEFPTPGSSITVAFAATADPAELATTTATLVLDGDFSDIGHPQFGAKSGLMRLRSGDDNLSGRIAWSNRTINGETFKFLQGRIVGSTSQIVSPRNPHRKYANVFLPVDLPVLPEPGAVRGSVPAVGHLSVQIVSAGTDPSAASFDADPTTATIHVETDLTSGTIRNNSADSRLYDWQRVALSTLGPKQ